MNKALLITLIALFAVHSSADFASDCLSAHNAYRIPLNVTPLSWSADIAKSAQAWAENIAVQRKLVHGPATGYGENLAARTGQYVQDNITNTSTTSTSKSTTTTTATTTPTSSSSSNQTGTVSSNNNSASSTSNNNTQASATVTSPKSNSSSVSSQVVNSSAAQTSNTSKSSIPSSNQANAITSSLTTSNTSSSNALNNQNGNSTVKTNSSAAQISTASNTQNGNISTNSSSTTTKSNISPSPSSSLNTQNSNTNRSSQSFRRYNDGGNSDSVGRSNRVLEEIEEQEDDVRNLASYNNTVLVTGLIGQWGAEKQYFIYGVFPNVAVPNKTVGHYTQMVWGETTQVGCGIANNDGGWVYFVCQYYPYGNVWGEVVY